MQVEFVPGDSWLPQRVPVTSGLVYGLCNYPDDNSRTLLLQYLLGPDPDLQQSGCMTGVQQICSLTEKLSIVCRARS